MKYYTLERDPVIEWGASGAPNIPPEVGFLEGALIRVPLPVPVVVPVNHPLDSPPKAYVPGRVPAVQNVLAEVLRDAGADNFEAFPARLTNRAVDAQWDDYVAFNVVGLVDAVDMAQSRSATLIGGGGAGEPPPLVAFDRVVLRAGRTRGLRMFRVPESPTLWFVDAGVVRYLRANRPPGGWGLTVQPVDVVP
jgi:hypothetical protein